jgi:hypothetical protein
VLVAYAWLMGVRFIDPLEAERLKFIRVAVSLAIVAVLLLQQLPWVHRRLAALGLGFTADRETRRASRRLPRTTRRAAMPRAPWAYGPGGRMLVGFIVVYHLTAIAYWELPDKDSPVDVPHPKAREAFSAWVSVDADRPAVGDVRAQPPRHNVFMKILLTDESGEVWDMRNDLYAPERKPIPWIWNDRMRKMNRRVIGGESGKGDVYQKWYGRYLCREWARTHRGVMPEKVELFKISLHDAEPRGAGAERALRAPWDPARRREGLQAVGEGPQEEVGHPPREPRDREAVDREDEAHDREGARGGALGSRGLGEHRR